MAQNRYRIRVHGALALGLYVSRALCAAPLVFETRKIRISHFLSVVGRVFFTITCIFVVFDGYLTIFLFTPGRTFLSRIFWALIVGGVLITNIIAVYTAETRMHLYLHNLQCLNQINLNTDNLRVRQTRRINDKIIKYYIVVCLMANIIPYSVYLIHGFEWFNAIMIYRHIFQTIIHCTERILVSVLTMQFALLTLEILYTLRNVNTQFCRATETHCVYNDVLEVTNIWQYALHYMSVCNIVRQMIDNEEKIIIIILIIFYSTLGWIVQTSFSEIYKNGLANFIPNAIQQLLTGATYLVYLILLIEPCHRVHEEMDITHRLVCKSMHCPNLSVQVSNELKAFKLLLELNKPTYSPLRVCTLARPLFLKIVGALITYSVFVVQLSDDFF